MFAIFLSFLCSMLVERIDEDKDGYVTVDEMKKWIKHAQKRWIYDDVDRQWKSHDLNGDEVVSWEEYKNATYGYILGTAADNFHFMYLMISVLLPSDCLDTNTYSLFWTDLQMTPTLMMVSATGRWWLVMRGDSKWPTKTMTWKPTRRSSQPFFIPRSMITWKIS